MRFRLFQNLNRLRIVNDICPLPGFPSHDPFAWKGVAAKSTLPLIEHANGYTVTDFQNRFVTWHRTFTHNLVIPVLASSSLVHIHEWIPPTEPPASVIAELRSRGRRYRKFSMNHFEAIAVLGTNPTKRWSSQARRHLAATKKNPMLKLGFGTIADIETMLPSSQVPRSLHDTFLDFAKRHIAAHPQDIEVLIATLNGTVVAGFVAGYCAEARESSYLVGCFTGDGGKAHAMVALVAWWFERCAERGMLHANFGDIVGPRPFPFDDMIGYSNFKTHFNIHRVWMPGGRWRVTLSFQFLYHLLFKRHKI